MYINIHEHVCVHAVRRYTLIDKTCERVEKTRRKEPTVRCDVVAEINEIKITMPVHAVKVIV